LEGGVAVGDFDEGGVGGSVGEVLADHEAGLGVDPGGVAGAGVGDADGDGAVADELLVDVVEVVGGVIDPGA
jgi:hypothetical protein